MNYDLFGITLLTSKLENLRFSISPLFLMSSDKLGRRAEVDDAEARLMETETGRFLTACP